jgi:threonine/homoserine/homoserine lactone efflux protein
VSFLFVITRGADWAYAIAAGLRHGVVLPAVGGLLVGHLMATAVVAAEGGRVGGPVAADLDLADSGGRSYLVWLGIGMLAQPATPGAHNEEPVGSWPAASGQGRRDQPAQPKGVLAVPQFIDPEAAWPVAAQIVVLGLVHVASCAVVYTGVGTGARRLLRARPPQKGHGQPVR